MAKVARVRGKWILDYTDLIGRRHRQVSPVQTRKGAEKLLRDIQERLASGALDGDRVRFDDFATEWLQRKQSQLKSTTWQASRARSDTTYSTSPTASAICD
jgi:hypothetical protein